MGRFIGILDGPHKNKWIAFREFYYSGKNKLRKTNAELANDLVNFLNTPKKYYPSSIELDPSALSFKTELLRKGLTVVRNAENAVTEGIRIMSSMFVSDKLLVHDSCVNLLNEVPGYVWDSKASERGEDKPISAENHVIDSLRYACFRANKMI